MEVSAILQALGLRVTHDGANWRTNFLDQGTRKAKSLVINKKTGEWRDFRSGRRGGIEWLVKEILGLKHTEVAKDWLKQKGFSGSVRIEDGVFVMPKIRYEVFFQPYELFKNYTYWINRRIDPKILQELDCGLDYGGMLAGRFVFPIYNADKRIQGFAGRDVLDKATLGNKYRESEWERAKWKLIGGSGKLNWEYPLFLNKDKIENSYVILVESIGDYLTLKSCGIENVLVLFGTELGRGVFKALISANPKKIFISLNNDNEESKFQGQVSTGKIVKKLLKYFDEDVIVPALPEKNDFGVMTPREIGQWRMDYKVW